MDVEVGWPSWDQVTGRWKSEAPGCPETRSSDEIES
jgi:hypothetical protein